MEHDLDEGDIASVGSALDDPDEGELLAPRQPAGPGGLLPDLPGPGDGLAPFLGLPESQEALDGCQAAVDGLGGLLRLHHRALPLSELRRADRLERGGFFILADIPALKEHQVGLVGPDRIRRFLGLG